ncbi:hypothetical protein CDD82_7695 [Ophiocordyceps australis]|uniref:Uncharacterized protein n=1 Tax=Ophiocordyceps australis TaxID=1399860 RepID=A0A2C5YJ60_9HYPO|nr:hypothetical protein CDD82_7695 [Ophiocordyceps australis]
MSRHYGGPNSPNMAGNGLRFLNDKWNDSISNGDPISLQWNQSLTKPECALGLFKIVYPRDGVVEYEMVSNLTDSMGNMACWWTPQDLGNELYVLWLTTDHYASEAWAISPPWTPKHVAKHNNTSWAAPFVVSVVCMLALYVICLATCLVYRRRRSAKSEPDDEYTPANSHVKSDVKRISSLDSTNTDLESLPDRQSGVKERPGMWVTTSGSSSDTAVTSVSGAVDGDVGNIEQTQLEEDCIYDSHNIGTGL